MAVKKTPVPANSIKPATGAEAFEQMRNSRLLLERTLQGVRELDAGQGIPWADFLKEVEAREREAEGHAAG